MSGRLSYPGPPGREIAASCVVDGGHGGHSDGLTLHDASMPTSPAERALVMTLRSISEGRERVTLVVHEDDDVGGWQFVTMAAWSNDDLLLVHESHLDRADPSLLQLAELPCGRYAARDTPGDPWRYGDISEIETQ